MATVRRFLSHAKLPVASPIELMTSIIDEIQTLSYESSVPIADLLRRVKVAASKLELADTVTWVDAELNGYTEAIPDYRMVPQRLVYWNLVHGWQPVMGADARLDSLSQPRPVPLPIREIEELSRQSEPVVFMSVAPEIQRMLLEGGVPGEARSQFGRTALTGILDVVRTRCLDWAIKLDRAGIHGQGVSFTAEEKQLAQQQAVTINLTVSGNANFAGPIGSSTGPVNVNATQTVTASVTADARKLAVSLREGAATTSESERRDVNEIADEIQEAVKSAPPDEGRLKKALDSARAAVPRLVLWAGRVAAENEIGRLLHALGGGSG